MSKGFTLVELLVVLVIIGVVMSVVLLTVRAGGEGRLARDEIRRIEGIVTLANDEAVLRMTELGIEFHIGGYRVLAWSGTEWLPHGRSGAFGDRNWPEGLSVRLEVETRPVNIPTLPAEPPRPHIVFLSSGEVSPFRLELVDARGDGERLTTTLTASTERTVVAR